MQAISREEFEHELPAFDAAVSATDGIDRFCSASAWVLPAHEAFHPKNTTHFFRSDVGPPRFAAFSHGFADNVGHYISPLEAMWGLSCPFVGEGVADDTANIAGVLRELPSWRVAILSGIPLDSPLLRELAYTLSHAYQVRVARPTDRRTGSLEGGLDGFLGRRSSRFRNNLKRAIKRNAEDGVLFERHELRTVEAAELYYARALDVESRSWKGIDKVGINAGPMRDFTHGVLQRAAVWEGAVGIIATQNGRDVGFIYGGLHQKVYRGLQMSFDASLRDLATGNCLQWKMIEWLIELGYAEYDLGSDLPYKHRWSEVGVRTVTLLAFARGRRAP